MLQWIKGLFTIQPIADNRDVHIISIHFPNGFSLNDVEIIKPSIRLADINDLIQPSTINSYFAINETAKTKIASVKSSLDSLANDESVSTFQYGEARGECTGEFDSKGLLASTPFGEVLNKAIRNAQQQIKIA